MTKTCGQCNFFEWLDPEGACACYGYYCTAPAVACATFYGFSRRVNAEQNANYCQCFKRKTKKRKNK